MTEQPTQAASDARFEWTPERIARVRQIAKDYGTARDAAEAVGLDPEREHLIYRLARKEGFRFSNIGRKRDDGAIFIKLEQTPADILTARARETGKNRRELAARLLSIVLMQGPTFIDNLLDGD